MGARRADPPPGGLERKRNAVTVSSADWAKALARQADADFRLWQRLQLESTVAECHRLHLLQMACEKLAKAYHYNAGTNPAALQSSRNWVAKTLPTIMREMYRRRGRRVPRHNDYIMRHAKQLAREIDLLAPSVDDDGRRPDNCEYPWDQGGRLISPLDHSFPALRLANAPHGRAFLKAVAEAIAELC